MLNTTIENLGTNDPEEFINRLDHTSRSIGYEIIRDKMTKNMYNLIRNNKDLYERFQDIKLECKKSYEYDNKLANMLDVNTGLTNLYNIVLRLFGAYRDGNDETLDEICKAINIIEEKLSINKTEWHGGQINATDNIKDVEGIKTDNNRIE